ncbi:MBL fold metallo-hydrolase [Penaeicola halotolerans]|uniref:MBL fold metallo-hydrolase n=1 Tax=Penaeicola halotolerans TaxID=2793196 RepID=UPI001CF9000E|nr:MBL fold metallo-hydrolase [Penaeicola halotolerans]
MKVTFLGTGTSQGVPVIGCDCAVCRSIDFKDKRLRCAIHLQIDQKSIVIDTGPDFRQQMLRSGISDLHAVLYTHEHKDHTAGLDDIRPFNFMHNRDIPVYGRKQVLQQLQQEFAYIFAPQKYPGIPRVLLREIDETPFEVEGISITPIKVMHHKLPVFGFRVGDFTYITDANAIPDESKAKIRGSKILVINALQQDPHISHFTLEEAVEFAQEMKAEQTYFTHISHRMGLHHAVQKTLPTNIFLAYDGLSLEL